AGRPHCYHAPAARSRRNGRDRGGERRGDRRGPHASGLFGSAPALDATEAGRRVCDWRKPGDRLRPAVTRLMCSTLVMLAVWTVAWATGLSARFTFESVRSMLADTGLWGLAAFVAAFVAGQLLRVPSFVFVAAAVAVHGRNIGILVAFLGALSSA